MTGIATTTSGTDPFWQRVRQALFSLRPSRQRATRSEPTLVASASRRLNPRIEEDLAVAWNHSAGRNVSMSVLVVELDLVTEFFSVYGRAATDDCIAAVTEIITAALPRDEDSCVRLGRASFVVVMADYPALMARRLGEEIAAGVRAEAMVHKESHAGVVTASIGVAVVNPRDEYNPGLFDAAAEALRKAQRRGLGRVETIDMRPMQQEQAA